MANTLSGNQPSVASGICFVGRGQGSPKRPVCCSSLHRMYPPFVAQAGKVAGRGISKHAPASSSGRTRTHPVSFSTAATYSGEARFRSHSTSRSCQAASWGRSGQPVRSMICGPARWNTARTKVTQFRPLIPVGRFRSPVVCVHDVTSIYPTAFELLRDRVGARRPPTPYRQTIFLREGGPLQVS
jgi:hypothetical protein